MKSILLGFVVLFLLSIVMSLFKPTRKFMAKDIARNDILKKISNVPNPAEVLQKMKENEINALKFDDMAQTKNLPPQFRMNNLTRAEAEARIEVIEELLKKFQ